MTTQVKISNVSLKAATEKDCNSGLLGWISCVLDDTVKIDGITLRRTLDNRIVLSFPERRDAAGQNHPYVRPLGDGARRHIERQVFAALGLDG